MAKELRSLGWEYLMFALFVAFTVFTPLWKRLFGKPKQRSKADYVFATGGISIIAIMLSIARGTLGVRTVLGKFSNAVQIICINLCLLCLQKRKEQNRKNYEAKSSQSITLYRQENIFVFRKEQGILWKL